MEDASLYQRVRVSKGALPDQVARQVVDLITARRLEVGSRLPSLDELTGYLGVSRTAVREAIKLLDAWGVVTVKHGVGTFVTQPTGHALTVPFKVHVERGGESIRDLLQVREVLEPGIAAIAAKHARPEHIAEMEQALHKMDEALNDPDQFNEADLAFHMALAKATENDLFLLMIHPVVDLFLELFNVAHQVVGAAARGRAFHQVILEHVRTGDAEKAREAMHAHIRQVWLDVQPQLARLS
jgi:GntR family transcriptional repressor for pyruvate dehydrogenase complex